MMEVLICFGFCAVTLLIALLCKVIFDAQALFEKMLDFQSNRLGRIIYELTVIQLALKEIEDGRKAPDQS